jgi:hypothetical protein
MQVIKRNAATLELVEFAPEDWRYPMAASFQAVRRRLVCVRHAVTRLPPLTCRSVVLLRAAALVLSLRFERLMLFA